jgi:hypothetical protein
VTASAIFKAPEGGKVDDLQRSSGFDRNWIQADDLNRTFSTRGYGGGLHYMDAGVSDGGRLLR